MTAVAISQSNYIPWKGYFDLINSVDIFIIYDIVQYTKNDWRNRNKMIISGKAKWLTIPVKHENLHQRIEDIIIADNRWAKKHWQTLEQNYSRTPGFKIFGEQLEAIYSELATEYILSDINLKLIKALALLMNINTKIISATQFELPNDRVERIITMCNQSKAEYYISGPAAKSYLNPMKLAENGIKCQWMDYLGYKRYRQSGDIFNHHVSILDLLFNEGENFKKYMKSF